MKLYFFEITTEEIAMLKKEFNPDMVEFSSSPLTPESKERKDDVEVISIFVDSYITAEVLGLFPRLQLIVTRSTGYDHIDLQAAYERGITVCNAPTYAAVTVAEYTFALMLALSRNILPAYQIVKKNLPRERTQLEGFDLAGKTLGIVGTGTIGKKVARLARAFEMNVIAYDIYQDKRFAEQYDVVYASFTKLLEKSDVVTFHVNLNNETYHMLNRANLMYLKDGAFIINTARAAIIELAALAEGLQTKKIAGAGIDLLTERSGVNVPKKAVESATREDDELRTYVIHHEQVIVTPHNAFNTKESHDRVIKSCVDTIKHWYAKRPINRVR